MIGPFIDYSYQIKRLTKYFKIIRIIFGYSQEELAALLGISRVTIINYEKGSTKITTMMYLAMHQSMMDTAYRIEDTDYYIALWDMLIEGTDTECTNVSDEMAEKLSNFILGLAMLYQRQGKIICNEVGLQIKKVLLSYMLNDESDSQK